MLKTIILPVVLYGFDNWSLTLKDERWLRAFKSGYQTKTFGSETEDFAT
jgi:hypothetical protein